MKAYHLCWSVNFTECTRHSVLPELRYKVRRPLPALRLPEAYVARVGNGISLFLAPKLWPLKSFGSTSLLTPAPEFAPTGHIFDSAIVNFPELSKPLGGLANFHKTPYGVFLSIVIPC